MEDINSRSTVAQSNILEQAKEMEIKQTHEYAEFAIRCDRKDMKILNFDGYINLENTEQ
jgi:hypothetical protein